MYAFCVFSEQKMSRQTNGVSLVQTASSYFACVAEWLRLSLPISNTWPSAFRLLTEDMIFQGFIFQEFKVYCIATTTTTTTPVYFYWAKVCDHKILEEKILCICRCTELGLSHFIYQTSLVNQCVRYCQFPFYLWLIMVRFLNIVLWKHLYLLYLFNPMCV